MHFLLALVLAALSCLSAHCRRRYRAAGHAQDCQRQRALVPNAGQWNEQVSFAAQTFAGTVFLITDGKLVFSLPGNWRKTRRFSRGGVENAAKPVRGPSSI
ncbi:MAG: hypothetical protein IPI73_24045 [Betaproteobacteria bacterium]|nr:hypothetical protein [Betaproteobacteria bacterium]